MREGQRRNGLWPNTIGRARPGLRLPLDGGCSSANGRTTGKSRQRVFRSEEAWASHLADRVPSWDP